MGRLTSGSPDTSATEEVLGVTALYVTGFATTGARWGEFASTLGFGELDTWGDGGFGIGLADTGLVEEIEGLAST